MQLKINNKPVFNIEMLNALEKNASAFGEEYFNPTSLQAERENIISGSPSKRCEEDVICYEIILEDGKHVGDITLTPISENEFELDIIIFIPNKGYGSAALNKLVNIYKRNYDQILSAMILNDNPIKESVIMMFEKSGFTKEETYSNGVGLRLNS